MNYIIKYFVHNVNMLCIFFSNKDIMHIKTTIFFQYCSIALLFFLFWLKESIEGLFQICYYNMYKHYIKNRSRDPI